MQKTLRAAKLGLLLGIASLLVLLATPGLAKADYYAFWGYDPTTGLHGLTLAKPDGIESPHPLRWWPPPGYTTISTWYKLGSSLDARGCGGIQTLLHSIPIGHDHAADRAAASANVLELGNR
ncbi:MAG: hypothetical protein GX604_03130 [Actinobacteria bacterium]|nr:hypothetical protein [Actinomycetota bacterium]